MNDPQDLTITVTNADGDRMTQTLAWDANLADLAHACRTLAFWLTYPAEMVERYLPDPTREWRYDDEPDEHGPEGGD